MNQRPKIWLLLGLLLLAGVAGLWQVEDRPAVKRRGSVVPLVALVPSVPLPRSAAAAPGNPGGALSGKRSYRLSNTSASAGELAGNPRGILLRNALIDTGRPLELGLPAGLRAAGAPGSYLVQSDRPLNGEFYAALRRDGAEFVSYIPNNTALVQATAEAARVMVADGVFQAVLPYEPYFKLDGSLLPEAVNGELLTNNQLRVTVYPGQEEAAAKSLAALGAVVSGREPAAFGSVSLITTVPPDRLAAVARLPQTQEIEAFSSRHLLNDLTRVRLGISTNTFAKTNYLNLTGSNEWVVLDDTGVDATHPDFGPGRVAGNLPSALTDLNGHGTHVAGTIIGGGNQSGSVSNAVPGSGVGALYSGMARQASVYVQQVDLLTGPYVSDAYLQSNASFVLTSMAATNAAMVTNGYINNLSWGYQSTVYDLAAASYDLATRDSQPLTPGEQAMLFVVAAGNGNQAPGSITSPATAKNVIAVTAVDSPRFITNTVDFPNQGVTNDAIFQGTTFDSNQVAGFSSGGNVGAGLESDGGRFKPDVAAPGVFTISTRSANYQDPVNQQVLNYGAFAGQSVLPGQSNIYAVTVTGGTTNLTIQILPNELSPAPFPTNLQIYFDTFFPPRLSSLVPVSQTNAAGLPVALNPAPTNWYLEILSPGNQPWPVAYDLRLYGLQTNDFGTYYTVLSNLNSALAPSYRYESGTSMAAGAVSGMLALVQQYLRSNFNASPSPALLKGLLINGARPLNRQSDLNPAPAVNLEGWGLPNLANSIPASLAPSNPNHSMVFYDQSPANALQTGQWHNYTVSLGDANATNYPLRITLVWTDPPGNPAAGLALVNDLDLVVTDVTGSNVYIGNDFLAGDIYTEVSPSNSLAASDTVNNVENVYIDASFGLLPPYTVSVRGARVNVNAVTTQTNVIGQDYALIIASDDQVPAAPLAVADNGLTNAAVNAPLVTAAQNGVALLHQRVGANEPNLDQYPGGGLYNNPGNTNGSLAQWHFFYFTNINYHTTNNTFTNSAGVNIAASYINAIFATFLPPTLTVPISSPVNGSFPAANNADLDLYVSTNPLVTVNNTFDQVALANASKSLGRGGSETVFFTNIASVPVFYVGVKSESQQGGDFAFYAVLTTNFPPLNSDGSLTVQATALPVVIPDSFDTGGVEGADVFVFVATPMTVRKAAVQVGVEHSNPADLYGTFSHFEQQAVLNHLTGPPGGFTNFYDDLPDGSAADMGAIPSDGPGTLQNFIGLEATGQWRLNEKDNTFTQTGMVTMLALTVWPQPPNALDFTNILLPGGSYLGYVDVPDYATNLNIAVGFSSGGPEGIYLTNQQPATSSDYGTIISLPGGSLNLSTNPPSLGPPLSAGRWYYDITNQGSTSVTNHVVITILPLVGQTPNLTLTEFNNTPQALGTDSHTLSQICLNSGLLAGNQQLVSLQAGVRIAKTNADNLVLHLTSPQGTSLLLYEDRGGPGVTNLGLTDTNGNYLDLVFTENTNLAPQLVKFDPPPFGQLAGAADPFVSTFETVIPGDYGQGNGLLPAVLGTTLEGWTVVSNDVAVVTNRDLYPAYLGLGTNYLALASGVMTNTFPTVIGQNYALSYVYRGPGLVDWWPMEDYTNIVDVVGTNNGTLTAGGPVTNITGQVGQGIQFPSSAANPAGATINFGAGAGNFGTNDFSVDFWINTASSNPTEAFLEKRGTCNANFPFWGIRIGGAAPVGAVGFELDSGGNTANLSLVATYPINDGRWHHVVCVRKGMDHYIYIDGTFNSHLNSGTLYNVGNSFPLIMGTAVCQCCDGTVPYTGAVDELDLWNRALTDVEIAAIYQAGTNHIGKANPTSVLPNVQILLNGLTNTTLVAPASSTNWLTNTVFFTAVNSNTALTLQGHTLGMLFDDFVLQTPLYQNYVLPEESLAPFTGQNPSGCWTLDVWDTRSDSPAPTNGWLLSWNLQMTVSSTNVNLIVLTNHVGYSNGVVAANDIAYFAFDVPAGANFDTNSLFNGFTNGPGGLALAPLTLVFNQTALPTGNNFGDYTLFSEFTPEAYVLANNTPPPSLLPGARYFLGVQNTNAYPATFTLLVDTQVITNTTAIPLTNAVAYTNTITNAPQYYSFVVPTNAILASFEIINPTNELDLYARHALPLPGSLMFDYKTSYQGTNNEAIVVTTNSFDPASLLQVTTNSAPVPLTPGTWYLAVYNFNTNSTNTYLVMATYLTNTLTNSPITITPLTNFVTANGAWETNGTIGPGPDLTNFYSYTVANTHATAVQFVVSNLSGNVDLIARNGALPTPQEMTDGSFNLQTIPEQITIVTNAAVLPSLVGATWYLGVPNNTAQTVSFLITATTLTNTPPGYTVPAVVLTGMSLGTNGFTLNWAAAPGAQYQVKSSADLVQWTNTATITAPGYSATYTDPAPVPQQSARFYQVTPIQ